MARTKSAVLTLSNSKANLNRCVLVVNWISRRLHREQITEGKFYLRGRDPYVIQGVPFISLPVFETISDTGLNGVDANTEAARECVSREWGLLKQEWLQTLSGTSGCTRSTIIDLIGKTNAWLDATLHTVERKRMQAYLRQVRHSHGRTANRAHQSTQIRISRELYEQITSGIPRGKRAKFVSCLLDWASTSLDARSFALSAVDI